MILNKVDYKKRDGTVGINYYLWCPACDDLHAPNDTWEYDDNAEKPTLNPSILVEFGVEPEDKRPFRRCHSFVRNGIWEYLPDSTHHLAGKTAEVVSLPDWLID